MEDLKKRIAELEKELRLEKSKNESSSIARPKISQMSSEVVDTVAVVGVGGVGSVTAEMLTRCGIGKV